MAIQKKKGDKKEKDKLLRVKKKTKTAERAKTANKAPRGRGEK